MPVAVILYCGTIQIVDLGGKALEPTPNMHHHMVGISSSRPKSVETREEQASAVLRQDNIRTLSLLAKYSIGGAR